MMRTTSNGAIHPNHGHVNHNHVNHSHSNHVNHNHIKSNGHAHTSKFATALHVGNALSALEGGPQQMRGPKGSPVG